MPSYTAPVEDMMFLFEKLRDNKNYNDLLIEKEKIIRISSNLLQQAHLPQPLLLLQLPLLLLQLQLLPLLHQVSIQDT